MAARKPRRLCSYLSSARTVGTERTCLPVVLGETEVGFDFGPVGLEVLDAAEGRANHVDVRLSEVGGTIGGGGSSLGRHSGRSGRVLVKVFGLNFLRRWNSQGSPRAYEWKSEEDVKGRKSACAREILIDHSEGLVLIHSRA